MHTDIYIHIRSNWGSRLFWIKFQRPSICQCPVSGMDKCSIDKDNDTPSLLLTTLLQDPANVYQCITRTIISKELSVASSSVGRLAVGDLVEVLSDQQPEPKCGLFRVLCQAPAGLGYVTVASQSGATRFLERLPSRSSRKAELQECEDMGKEDVNVQVAADAEVPTPRIGLSEQVAWRKADRYVRWHIDVCGSFPWPWSTEAMAPGTVWYKLGWSHDEIDKFRSLADMGGRLERLSCTMPRTMAKTLQVDSVGKKADLAWNIVGAFRRDFIDPEFDPERYEVECDGESEEDEEEEEEEERQDDKHEQEDGPVAWKPMIPENVFKKMLTEMWRSHITPEVKFQRLRGARVAPDVFKAAHREMESFLHMMFEDASKITSTWADIYRPRLKTLHLPLVGLHSAEDRLRHCAAAGEVSGRFEAVLNRLEELDRPINRYLGEDEGIIDIVTKSVKDCWLNRFLPKTVTSRASSSGRRQVRRFSPETLRAARRVMAGIARLLLSLAYKRMRKDDRGTLQVHDVPSLFKPG